MTFFNQWTSQEKRTSYQLRPAISCSRYALFLEMFPRVNPNTSNRNLDKAQKMSNFDCKKITYFRWLKFSAPQQDSKVQYDSRMTFLESGIKGLHCPGPPFLLHIDALRPVVSPLRLRKYAECATCLGGDGRGWGGEGGEGGGVLAISVAFRIDEGGDVRPTQMRETGKIVCGNRPMCVETARCVW